MSRGGVIVVGAINVDFVAPVRTLPRAGETVLGARIDRHGGGKGANAAVAAARLGADVMLVGAVGADQLGPGALSELVAEGVDVSGVTTLEGVPTGAALIVVDEAGENQIAVGGGANLALSAEHVDATLRQGLGGAACVLVSAEIPDAAVAAAVRAADRAGVRCVLNPAPARPELLELASATPLLTPNSGEARLLTGEEDPGAAAAALAARTGKPVVVTLGGDGALMLAGGRAIRHRPPPGVRVVDTTGAGDAFNGTLSALLAAGAELDDAVERAVAAASASVGVVGARGRPQPVRGS